MAHECPECGQTCYCGGDIADCCNNYERDVALCSHYKQCELQYQDDDCDCYECADEKIV